MILNFDGVNASAILIAEPITNVILWATGRRWTRWVIDFLQPGIKDVLRSVKAQEIRTHAWSVAGLTIRINKSIGKILWINWIAVDAANTAMIVL